MRDAIDDLVDWQLARNVPEVGSNVCAYCHAEWSADTLLCPVCDRSGYAVVSIS